MDRLGFNSSHWNCQLSHFTFRQLHLKTFRVSDFKYRWFTSRLTWACHLGVFLCKPIWQSKNHSYVWRIWFRRFDRILQHLVFGVNLIQLAFHWDFDSSDKLMHAVSKHKVLYTKGQSPWPGICTFIREYSPYLDCLYLSLKNTTTVDHLISIVYPHIWTTSQYEVTKAWIFKF